MCVRTKFTSEHFKRYRPLNRDKYWGRIVEQGKLLYNIIHIRCDTYIVCDVCITSLSHGLTSISCSKLINAIFSTCYDHCTGGDVVAVRGGGGRCNSTLLFHTIVVCNISILFIRA